VHPCPYTPDRVAGEMHRIFRIERLDCRKMRVTRDTWPAMSKRTALTLLLLVGVLGSVSSCRSTSPDLACTSGDAFACARLGDQSFNGGQKGADLEAARAYFGRSCERGFLPGCHGLGLVAREQKRFGDAARLLAQACEQGYARACTSAGDLQRVRNQERPDVARSLYARACEQFDAEGCLQLAFLEEAGEGGTADPESARTHYEMAIDHYRSLCHAGYGVACYRYAEFEGLGDRDQRLPGAPPDGEVVRARPPAGLRAQRRSPALTQRISDTD
jgi:hypothetical protein